jgi:hypothetical protein
LLASVCGVKPALKLFTQDTVTTPMPQHRPHPSAAAVPRYGRVNTMIYLVKPCSLLRH